MPCFVGRGKGSKTLHLPATRKMLLLFSQHYNNRTIRDKIHLQQCPRWCGSQPVRDRFTDTRNTMNRLLLSYSHI